MRIGAGDVKFFPHFEFLGVAMRDDIQLPLRSIVQSPPANQKASKLISFVKRRDEKLTFFEAN